MDKYNTQLIYEKIKRMRKIVISSFAGMNIDMDYLLCIPSVHATWGNEEAIIDFEGSIRKVSDSFPKEQLELLIKWVLLHKHEIIDNHYKIGHHTETLTMIPPLKTD